MMPIMTTIGNTSKIDGPLPPGTDGMRVSYQDYARMIEVCCIATMLRNFPISSLRGDEVEEFVRLQNFFIETEARCFDEIGFE